MPSFPAIRGRGIGGSKVASAQPVITSNPTLTTLTLTANGYVLGSSQGTVIGTVLGLTTGSTLLLTDANNGAVQLVSGVIQVGPIPPVTPELNIQLTEVLSTAVNTPNVSTISITEGFVIPTINTPASIPGTPHVGAPITAIDAVWNNGVTSLAYQWKVGGVNGTGTGATTLTYTPVIGDLGQTLTITVTATNQAGASAPSTSAASAAVQAALVSEAATYVLLLAA